MTVIVGAKPERLVVGPAMLSQGMLLLICAHPLGRDIPLDQDVPLARPRFGHVVGELHAQKVVHVRTERLFDAKGHFRRQSGLASQKVGKRGAAYFQKFRRL